ncbi:phospholipase D family protein [Pseudarthrobacter sp. NS4]|uniref:phospholipase D family protein n=1 Tax=Pseudarthrobacter sp. NS4 TaxID=2973976 RepID=UPI0021619EE3|nr:phospholipase D family protein [Pseudarthrobacter sp. NS4]
MKIKFVPQPYADQSNLADWFDHISVSSAYTEFHMVVAWAKKSGLGRIQPLLHSFGNRPGNKTHAVVGVSEGGASEQGLDILATTIHDAYVFHDAGRTFHPKVYVASGSSKASLFIGSNNMTAGGLAWNYEAALWIDLDRDEADDEALYQSVMDYYKNLVADTNVCIPLNASTMPQILASPALRIQDEDIARRPASSRGDEPEDDDAVSHGIVPDLFGRSATEKRRLPLLPGSGPTARARSPLASPVPTQGPGRRPTLTGMPAQLPAAFVVKRWFKTMDKTAAQQPPSERSNPTGNLRLSQEGFPIQHKTYFEQVFFSGLPWAPRPNDPTVAEVSVQFDVYIDGQSYGMVPIVVSHAPHRIAGQGNVPTVLHWGPLSQILRQGNFVDEVITLERIWAGRYRLIISPHIVGPFMP